MYPGWTWTCNGTECDVTALRDGICQHRYCECSHGMGVFGIGWIVVPDATTSIPVFVFLEISHGPHTGRYHGTYHGRNK